MTHPPSSLPPGQRAGSRFPRFGAATRPLPSATYTSQLRISGAIETEIEIDLDDLRTLPRHDQQSNFHCVTTWTKEGLRWSGWRLVDLYREVIEPRCRPKPEVRYLVLFSHDGYCCSLLLDDALEDDVLIADTLDGEPLSPLHGAPLRIVSPRQYGYKSLKHLAAIRLRAKPVTLPLGLEHRRGRVDHQERHARYSPWLVRRPYRALIGATAFFQHRGIRSSHFVGRPTLLDELMPRDEHFEVHDIWIDATPEEAYRALIALRGDEIRLLRPLMALRGLPARLVGRGSNEGGGGGDRKAAVLESLVAGGFVRLAEEPGREIVLGVVGRFWKLTGNAPVRSVHDRQTFIDFNQPGYAKAAMNLLVRAEGRGSRLITETRINTTGPAAARSFRRYWRLVRPGSGLIRRSWLKAVQRRLIDPP